MKDFERMREKDCGEKGESPGRGKVKGFRGVRRCGGVELKLRRLGEYMYVLSTWDIEMPANEMR